MKFKAAIVDRKTRNIISAAGPFRTALEAWAWLKDERQADEDRHPNDVGEYSDTWANLAYLSRHEDSYGDPHHDYGYNGITGWGTRSDGTGTIPGDTPARMNSRGETPPDDHGINYSVEGV